MSSEQRELDKLRIHLNAVQSLDDDVPDFLAELKQCAWNVLHENPGYGEDTKPIVNKSNEKNI